MEDNKQTNLILSGMELNLCVHLLGRRGWKGYPVPRNDQNLVERASEALVHLMADGVVVRKSERVECTEETKELLQVAAFPDKVMIAVRANRVPVSFFFQGDCVTAIEQMTTQPDQCRVFPVSREKFLDFFLEEFGMDSAEKDWMVYLQILDGEGHTQQHWNLMCDHGEYQLCDTATEVRYSFTEKVLSQIVDKD